jgi:hypothetical protein
MAAPVIPEKPPEPQPEKKPEVPAPSPTNPFSQLSVEEKDRMLLQQAQTIRAGAQKQAEFDAKLKEMSDKINAPPPLDTGKLNKDFFSAPHTNIRDLIREELKESIAPLIEFKDQVSAQTNYDRLKAEFKADPRFKDILAVPSVESMLDEAVAATPNITKGGLYGVLVGIRGAMEVGDIPKPGGGAAPVGRSPSDISVPPHLRPSPPPLPDDETKGKDKVRELTENERRLAREKGMPSEEYLAWIDEAATSVSESKIGIKSKEEVKK